MLPLFHGMWALVALVLALAAGRGPALLPSGAECTAASCREALPGIGTEPSCARPNEAKLSCAKTYRVKLS